MSRQTPKNAVTARICTLYRDFSARSDSRFTASAPMRRTHPSKTGRKTGWVQITTTIPKGMLIHAMSTNTKRANPPHDRVAPHTRGFTAASYDCWYRVKGSPRVRGGLPWIGLSGRSASVVAPRTRGFTRAYLGIKNRLMVAPCTRGFTTHRPEYSALITTKLERSPRVRGGLPGTCWTIPPPHRIP